MKIFLSADIEGTTGIAAWDETEIGKAKYPAFAQQMTREVAAACRGAGDAGAELVVVKDAHDTGRNLDPAQLPEFVKIFRGWSRDPLVMMAGLDQSYDGAMFTGYHCAAGTNGNPLAHTMNLHILSVEINGEISSEWLINAYTAAYFGVPVRFLSGDAEVCDQAKRLHPAIVTVPTNMGTGYGSLSVHPDVAVRCIYEGAQEAAKAKAKSMLMKLPDEFHVKVSYREHHLARRASFYPGARLCGARSVEFLSADYMEVLRFFMFVL